MKAAILLFCLFAGYLNAFSFNDSILSETILVKRTGDFEITGTGESKEWNKASWTMIAQRKDTLNQRETKVKTMYSGTGIYFLFSNEDEFLTVKERADFDSLWLDDVNEVFLWPDTANPVYFEYELSPLNAELPLLVPNINGRFIGWRPWTYTKERKVKHKTSVKAGTRTGDELSHWTAEFFIPYSLLYPLGNVPAKPSTAWRANLYRVDYDNQKTVTWSWKKVEGTFHEFNKFGRLIFE